MIFPLPMDHPDSDDGDKAYLRRCFVFARKQNPLSIDFKGYRNHVFGQILWRRYDRDYPDKVSEREGLAHFHGGFRDGEVEFIEKFPEYWRMAVPTAFPSFDPDPPMQTTIEVVTYHRKVFRFIKNLRITETVSYHC